MMQRIVFRRFGLALLASVALAMALLTPSANAATTGASTVFTLTNAASGNAVAVFHSRSNGTLQAAGTIPTGGLGTGANLGSQGAVILSSDNAYLLAVNAGSNDISAIALSSGTVTSRVSSGGTMPVSLTIFKNLVYVVNAGGTISGFTLSAGQLKPLSGSTLPLSSSNAGPAEIHFSGDGHVLVVTEKNTNLIDTYTVNSTGRPDGPFTHPSNGQTPFGFAVRQNTLVVSEAAVSAASSYQVSDKGGLTLISGSVPNGQLAACWVTITHTGNFAYTADAHNGEISSYSIASNGSLRLLTGQAGSPGGGPLDEVIAGQDQFLYVLNPGSGQINAFAIHSDGSLKQLRSVGGIPASATGLAIR